MEIFYGEKAFHAGEKIRKNDFAPSENFSCYAPAWNQLYAEKIAGQSKQPGVGLPAGPAGVFGGWLVQLTAVLS